jgi:hypothetical protein
MEESFWDKINGFWTRAGIKPAVGNAFVTGLIGILAYWIIDGGTFDATELRLLVGTFLLSLAGVASPPEPGSVMTKRGVVPRTGEGTMGSTYRDPGDITYRK